MSAPDLFSWHPGSELPPPDSATLGEVKQWLRRMRGNGEGLPCPGCEQHVKVYRRPVNARQAFALIALYRVHGMDWGHVPSLDPRLAGDGGMISMLRHWGLVEESGDRREDGGRAGWWRVTRLGRDYVHGLVGVASHAILYNGDCLRLEGADLGIRDALGSRFDYDELMGQRVIPAVP